MSAQQPQREQCRLAGVLVEYDDRPDEYTVFPVGSTVEDRTTTWITAREDSYIDLDGGDSRSSGPENGQTDPGGEWL